MNPGQASGDFEPEYFTFAEDSLRMSGGGEFLDLRTGSSVHLPLPYPYFIEKAWFTPVPCGQLVVYAITDNDSGSGRIALVEAASGSVLWRADIPGFNIPTPVLSDGTLFVSAIGFVGALDIASGEYIWRHDDLYGYREERRFNSFQAAEVTPETASFVEPSWGRQTPWRIVVDRESGKILSIGG